MDARDGESPGSHTALRREPCADEIGAGTPRTPSLASRPSRIAHVADRHRMFFPASVARVRIQGGY